jgi:hypothetical protein
MWHVPWPSPVAEQALIASINNFRQSMQRALQSALDSADPSLLTDLTKIEKAQRFADETGVHKAVCIALQELWHIPPGAEDKNPIAHADGSDPLWTASCREEAAAANRIRTYKFEFNKTLYTMLFRFNYARLRNLKPTSGTIELLADSDLVLVMSVCQAEGLSTHSWEPHEIKRLHIGPWVWHFVEIETFVRAQRGSRWARQSSDAIHRQAADILC